MKHKISPDILDERVVTTMILCCVLSISVLAYRYTNQEPFTPVTISVSTGTLYTGTLIRFRAETKNTDFKKLVWDFGDNTRSLGNGYTAHHAFTSPGIYEVTLIANNKKVYKTIHIHETPIVDKTLQPHFSGPLSARVGEQVIFQDFTPKALQWEWRFGETNSIDAFTKQASYTFQTTGLKTVVLVVNGTIYGVHRILVEPPSAHEMLMQNKPGRKRPVLQDQDPFQIRIYDHPRTKTLNQQLKEESKIVDKPTEQTSTPETSGSKEDILRQTIESMLKQVVAGNKVAEDFSAYLCTNLNIPVNYNGNTITFSQFCEELRSIKKEKKIKNVTILYETDEKTRCIHSMTVNLKKRHLLPI
jgi:PKD domain